MAIAADVSNMEKLCRSYRAELDAAEYCGECNQPVRWKRIDCLRGKGFSSYAQSVSAICAWLDEDTAGFAASSKIFS